MNFFAESVKTAFRLLFSLDPDIYEVIAVSLKVSLASTTAATLLGLPVGFLLATRSFFGRRTLVIIAHTLMGLPTVVVGLFLFSLLSRQGPFGGWNLLYTPAAMVIGQAVLAFPIVVALSHRGIRSLDGRILLSARTLGAGPLREAFVLIREGRAAVITAVLAGFGRVFGEVGVSFMLGGNIRFFTRNIPTAIALETSKGEFAFGLALGIVLLSVALAVNLLVYAFSGEYRSG